MLGNRIRMENTMRRFASRTIVRRSLACVLGAVMVASAAWTYAASMEDAPGLVGILPNEPPDDLIMESFAILGGNWEKWSTGVAEDVIKLYVGDVKDAAAQRKALAGLRAKVGVMDKALDDSRYQSIYDQLLEVRGKLVRRLDLADAILNTLDQKPEAVKEAKLKEARAKVSSAVAALESDLQKVVGGSAWLPYVRAAEIKKAIQDGKSSDVSLDTARQRIAAVGTLKDEKQKQFLSRPAFGVLGKALDELQAGNQAEVKPVDAPALRAALAEVVKAVEAYELNNTSASAKSVRAALDGVNKSALDGNTVGDVIRSHYMNYNFQIVANEKFLSRLARNEHTESGPVRDFILGANVSGDQTTSTTSSIDLKPSDSGMKMNVTINGVTQSSTAGATDQATIYTQGYHTFQAAKPVLFDGEKLSTEPAQMVYVDANNQTVGASTRYDRTLFGGLARGIAQNEAAKKRSQSEAIAEQRLTDRVLPQFDTRLNDGVKKANDRLQGDMKKRLQDAGVYPTSVRVRSNESYVRYSSLVGTGDELSGDIPNPTPVERGGMAAHIHESLINNSLDRMKFAGRTMTDEDIRAELQRFATSLLGREVKLGQPKAAGEAADKTSTLVFADTDPVRVQIGNGSINLILRAGFKQEGKEDIPTQVITVPISLKVQGEKVIIDRGVVQVAPAAPPEDTAKQVVRAGVMRKKIEDALGTREADRKLKIAREGTSDISITLTHLKAANGWLTVWAD